jgi:hypothetical protein
MDRETLLQSLALLRLTVEKRARRQAVLDILQEEVDSISHFLDDFGREECSDLEDISKKKKYFEKEIVAIEKEICFILDKIDLVSLENYVAGANGEASYQQKMAETTEIPTEDVVA